jgi:ribosomal protein S18 acetylase RimI-like enzyme
VGKDEDEINLTNALSREAFLKGWNANHILYSREVLEVENTMGSDGVKCKVMVYDNVFGRFDDPMTMAPDTMLSLLRNGQLKTIPYTLLRTYMLLFLLNADYGPASTWYSYTSKQLCIYELDETSTHIKPEIPCHGGEQLREMCQQLSYNHRRQLHRDILALVIPDGLRVTKSLHRRRNNLLTWLSGLDGAKLECLNVPFGNGDTFVVCKSNQTPVAIQEQLARLHTEECDENLTIETFDPSLTTHVVYVISNQQQIKGFFTTYVTSPSEEKNAVPIHVVWNVCVSQKHRGNHLAQNMMSKYIKSCVKKGEKVWLATSPDSPCFLAAVRSYARLGFRNPKVGTLSPEGHVLPETIVFEYTHPTKLPTSEQVTEVIRKTMLLAKGVLRT